MCRTFAKVLGVLTMLALLASSSIAQERSDAKFSRHWGIPQKPGNSETNAVLMEQVRELVREEPNPNGVIILIARLGQGETNRELNRRRLFNVSQRYTSTLSIPAEKIIAAQGERVNDYGRVEIYWNGEMIGALVAGENEDLYVYCCGPNELYYPDKDAVEGRKTRRFRRKRS